jgi:hypothetical protein
MKYLIPILALLLLALPAQGQENGFFARYVADYSAPGTVPALANGDILCPPHSSDCRGYSQAHHHIDGADLAATYATDVLDVHHCNYVTVCVREADTDATLALAFVQGVSDSTGANATVILADVNGDGVINATDNEPLNGEAGDADTDGDGTARQTMCMYDITGINMLRLSVTQIGGQAADNSYAEVSCR